MCLLLLLCGGLESETGLRADLGSDPVGERVEEVGETTDLGSEEVGERAWVGLRISETGDLALPALLDSSVAVPDWIEGRLSESQSEGCFYVKEENILLIFWKQNAHDSITCYTT